MQWPSYWLPDNFPRKINIILGHICCWSKHCRWAVQILCTLVLLVILSGILSAKTCSICSDGVDIPSPSRQSGLLANVSYITHTDVRMHTLTALIPWDTSPQPSPHSLSLPLSAHLQCKTHLSLMLWAWGSESVLQIPQPAACCREEAVSHAALCPISSCSAEGGCNPWFSIWMEPQQGPGPSGEWWTGYVYRELMLVPTFGFWSTWRGVMIV